MARGATRVRCEEAVFFSIELAGGDSVLARSVVIATGARYRQLGVAELARFEGVGMYYSASHL